MWPSTLSGRLPIVALVGLYPANQLMGRGLIPQRSRRSFPAPHLCVKHRIRYYHMFPCAIPIWGADYPRVTHPSAALERAASVRSEPGSNSPLFNSARKRAANFFSLSCLTRTNFLVFLPVRSYLLTEASSFYFFSSLRLYICQKSLFIFLCCSHNA